MTPTEQHLSDRIEALEKELRSTLADKAQEFEYHFTRGKARFEASALLRHKDFKLGLPSYLLQSRFLSFVTAPVIYVGVIPFGLLDLFLAMFQGICFPVYGVPKARRADYIVFDRGRLKYLNILERINCVYCSYANGLFAYATEVAARTEQHWCPIKHAARLRSPHSRYGNFLEYGDAKRYRQEVEAVRGDFVDLKTLTEKPAK